MNTPLKREGFWYSEFEQDLPMPHANEAPFAQQAVFVERLRAIQRKATVIAYRGSSGCRICGMLNGNEEYEWNGWKWPSGYLHYITHHNVIPSDEFFNVVMKHQR